MAAPQIPPISSPDTVAPASIEAKPEYRVRLGVNGGVALAAGPGWAPSFALDAGVRWRDRPLSLAVEGSFVPPASGDVTSGAHRVHLTTYRVTGAAVACGHFVRFLFACGVATAGALHGTGTAMNLNAQAVTALSGGAGGRGGAEFPLHPRVAVRISGEAVVAIARPVIEASDMQVYRASLVSGTAGGGLLFTF